MSRKGVFIIIYSAATIVVLAVIWIVARWTGTIQFYHASTSSNEPTTRVGDTIFGSNLKAPKRGSFIFYRPTGSLPGEVYVHRLCAVGGDTLVIRNSIVYVNGENFDQNLNLKHAYAMPVGIALSLKEREVIRKDDLSYSAGDSTVIFIEDRIVVTQKLPGRRVIMAAAEPEEMIKEKYGKNWNKDNFGPIVIPKGNLFVLGDNRDNSLDSRYTGIITVEQWVGTQLE